MRGKERGAYEGLGTLADYMDGETMKIVISLEEEVSFGVVSMISEQSTDIILNWLK